MRMFSESFDKSPSLQRTWHLLLNMSSFVFSLVLIYCIYRLFQTYDWGQPFTKFLCFSGLFALVLVLFRHREQTDDVGNPILILESLFAALVLVLIFARMVPAYGDFLFAAPTVDIGYTTEHAAKLLFIQGENPYLSQSINIRPELAPEHRGFHYGPGMILGYAAAAYFPGIGYKLTSLVFLAITAIALCSLVAGCLASKSQNETNSWQVRSAVLASMVLLFLPERLWYEVLQVGANDIYPVALLLLGLVCVQKEKWVLAGVLMGLSFATKFSPAAFLLAMFLRKDIRLNFLIGCAIGASPLLVFLAWDHQSLIENVFILRFGLNFDSTSLYSITPEVLHVLFPLTQLCALIYFLVRNATRTLSIEETVVCFTLLLIIIEVTFKEIHANHLIWFYPLIALIVALYRHKLFPTK
ncbi:glycosyltransferase family 87 protein [Enterovibrio calviensis]|uniref:glycosyltransferase family 87 protein n=1 Tax=Enterovibrio calviensis TaxID=91359 RepID=UPI0004857074|nr:glycosyltransferase family 87 protein [Enterovibrio calviensis]